MEFLRALVATCFVALVGAESVFQTWSDTAFNLANEDCKTCNFNKSDFYVYAVSPSTSGKYKAFIADKSGRRSGHHDAILVLDPAPALRYGHDLYMFFIDGNRTEETCGTSRGSVLMEDGMCMQLWYNVCNLRAPRRRGGCKLTFLPEVRLENSENDSLACIPDLEGYNNECPTLIKHRKSNGCDPLETNTKNCDTTGYVRTECTSMKTCDHAVLVSGGWNRKMNDQRSIENLRGMKNYLQRNGFLQNNIRLFFANGLHPSYEEYLDLGDVYPSSIKLALRYHIRSLCEATTCADSIVIYLNNPSLSDGTSLLWDQNNDGIYEEQEIYMIREFLRDVQKCMAKRLIIFLDQSYADELVRSAHIHKVDMVNTIIIGVQMNETRDSMINALLNTTTSTCLSDIYDPVPEDLKYKGSADHLLNGTIFGAPCSQEEEFHKFFGCQNHSTLELMESGQITEES